MFRSCWIFKYVRQMNIKCFGCYISEVMVHPIKLDDPTNRSMITAALWWCDCSMMRDTSSVLIWKLCLGFGNVEQRCLFRSSEWSSKSVLMSVNNRFLTMLRVAFLLWFVLKYKAGGLVALGSWMLNGRCWIKHESVRGFLEWWYLNCLVGLVLLSI